MGRTRNWVRTQPLRTGSRATITLHFTLRFTLGLLSLGLSLGLSFGLLCLAAPTARAADCPGHPNAIGTSRTLVVDPGQHPRIGTMQYAETLPLADHEVVLTFDDGPLPHNSNQVLEILASQCVKATFFTIGRMARTAPEGVRKLRDAGHTIASHSQNHPLSMNHMPIERAGQEIDQGIASVKAALGEDADKSLAPFFRIPGLLRADNVEDYLAKQGIQVWSADFLADDWHHISPSRVYDLAIRRLEAKRKGILLLHDIQPRTVAALPRILNEMKARGYRIVHVVPATSDLPATPTDQRQWLPHGLPDDMVVARWPDIPHFVFADLGQLPAPAFSDLDAPQADAITHAELLDRRALPADGMILQQEAPWPSQFELLPETAATLPVPAQSLFELPIGFGAAAQHIAHSPRRMAANLREGGANRPPAHPRFSARLVQRRLRPGNGPASPPGRRPSEVEARANPGVAPAHRGRTNHLVQVKKRSA